jgi:hypothetical protein
MTTRVATCDSPAAVWTTTCSPRQSEWKFAVCDFAPPTIWNWV